MHIAVLGAGSWGTTVASLLAGRHDCTLWARDPELAREIDERDANSRLGDLIATCMSPLSRNRTLGEQLGASPGDDGASCSAGYPMSA